ncbi:MAG: aspartate kinase [Thermoplasmata archaeon]|nr:aspartate kinase [Thermoplasmata archaeon]
MLIVQKFGGTSLADAASRELLVGKVKKARFAGDEVILVVSAMGRKGDPYATDTLLDLLNEFPGGADGLTKDLLASSGEIISACVIASLLNSRGIGAQPMTAYTAGIFAEGPFGDAAPGKIDADRIRAVLDAGFVPVVTGFQGADPAGNILTLGRGGSDTSAVAIGAALGADFVDIYKDVPGVAKADPRLVKDAPFMKFIDYGSMFRLANHGARVLHDKSALLAKSAGLRIRVRSTFDDGEGTLIGPAGESPMPDFLGLASSPVGEDRVRIVAVFNIGQGAGGIAKARETARAMGFEMTELGCSDPDAIAFLCAKSEAAMFAARMFEALEC